MKRQVFLRAIAPIVAIIAVGGLATGCIFQSEPKQREFPDTAVDADTAIDGGDAGEDGGEAGPIDATDGGDGSDATGGTCDYRGNEEGVCSRGTVVAAGSDAGDAVSGDGGLRCRAPDAYRADESPPEDGEPPFDVCDGLDNDCDGIVDEGCPCNFNDDSQGVCGETTISSKTGDCSAPADFEPDESSCDGVDNDCDGVVDEGCDCIYQEGVADDLGENESRGVCAQGTISSESGTCTKPDDYVETETDADCDAKDNDCDGEVDENCTCEPDATGSCYTGRSGTKGTGICESGTRTCDSDGNWKTCDDETTPTDETCADDDFGNEVDEDCDGIVDEGCRCPYTGTTKGVCSEGTIGSQGNCTEPSDYEQDESSCDNRDNDCDGYVDEGCPCNYNGRAQGVCGEATRDDEGNCTEPDDYETDESTCDSKDNDCDGTADEGNVCACDPEEPETDSCYTGPSGTAGTGMCEEGTKTCQSGGSWGDCEGETTPASSPSTDEKSGNCGDSTDNDCDGAIDDGCPCDYKDNATGVCADSTIDDSGNCTKPAKYESSPESTCDDGHDNDCDGDADCDDSDCSGEVCGKGNGGATCAQNGSSCIERKCGDGVDNDNDGLTDCADPDCAGAYCEPGGGQGAQCNQSTCVEIACGDGDDNDGDNDIDEKDSDCRKTGLASCIDDRQCVSGDCGSSNQCAQMIIVTSKDYTDGDFGGLQGADKVCQNVMGKTLPGTWKAVMSTGANPAEQRLTVGGPIYNNSGDKLADGETDLWTSPLDKPVTYDEAGNRVGGSVWTGTDPDGSVDGNCGGIGTTVPCTCQRWSSDKGTDSGAIGTSDAKNDSWINDGTRACGGLSSTDALHLYCIDGQ